MIYEYQYFFLAMPDNFIQLWESFAVNESKEMINKHYLWQGIE